MRDPVGTIVVEFDSSIVFVFIPVGFGSILTLGATDATAFATGVVFDSTRFVKILPQVC